MHSHLKCMFGPGMDGKLLTSFCPYYIGRRGRLRRAETCGQYGVHITLVQDLLASLQAIFENFPDDCRHFGVSSGADTELRPVHRMT
jgi:hypothetical protein